MARPLRIDYPDTFYHVLSRGNERRPIYYEHEDYLKFQQLLEKTAQKFHVEIHAMKLIVSGLDGQLLKQIFHSIK